MQRCPGCSRHVKTDDSACPFCGERLRSAPAPMMALAPLLVGVALAGCGEKDDGSEEGVAEESGTSGMTTTTGSETETGGTDTGTTGTTGASASTTEEPESGGADYGGPEDADWGEESGAEDTTGTTTESSTGADETETTGGPKLDVGEMSTGGDGDGDGPKFDVEGPKD